MTLSDNLPAGYTWSLGGADSASCSINTVPNPDVLSCNFGTLDVRRDPDDHADGAHERRELRRHPEHGDGRGDE